MKKLHILYLVLMIAAAVLFVSLQNGDRSRPGARTSQSRKGPATRKRREPPPLIRMAGHVQEAEGAPVKGATVFVLKKSKRGAERDDVPHVVTGTDGRWTLRTRNIVDCWIGVVAPGYRNAYLDGNTVDPSVQMFLVVTPAPPLEVVLRDAAGAPVTGQGVQLEPWPPADSWFLPGPESRQPEAYGVTDAQGTARFLLGTAGPVRISAQLEGRHTHPASTWLADARGTITMSVHPSTSVEVHLVATEGDAPIEGVVTLTLFDRESGRSRGSFTEVTAEPGLLRVVRALRPGTYDVHVRHPDFKTSILADVVIPEAPATARLDVALGPAVAPGRLRLRLEGVTRSEGKRRRAPLSFLLRDEDGWRRLGWQPGAPEEWDRNLHQLTYELPPGRYHLIVADVVSGRAAFVQGLEIGSDTSLDRTLRLDVGIQPTLPPLTVDERHPRTLRIGSGPWKNLPVYGSTPGARTRMGEVLACISRQDCGESVRLGPYPFSEITLEIIDWSDAIHTHTLK
jgi:hypothetical protein